MYFRPFSMIIDGVEACFLGSILIVLEPLKLFKGPFIFSQLLNRTLHLMPRALLCEYLKSSLDWSFGRIDDSILRLECLIGTLEDELKERREFGKGNTSFSFKLLLEDLYSRLAKAYLISGFVDDAALVILRAEKVLGIVKLRSLAELDAKTSLIIRAGIRAGRMLDEDGFATVYVKSEQSGASKPSTPKSKYSKARQNKISPLSDSENAAPPPQGGKVIPFPIIPPLN